LAKEDEVAEIHQETGQIVFECLLTRQSTRTHRIGPRVHDQAHHHLGNLHAGEQHADPPRDVKAKSSQGVVGVHARVNREVHVGEPATRCGVLAVAEIAVGHYRNVMIPVKKD